MEKCKCIGIVLLCLLFFGTVPVRGEQKAVQEGKLFVDQSRDAPQCPAGGEAEVIVPLINREDDAVTNVLVTPVQDASTGTYPFEITRTNIFDTIDRIEAGQTGEAAFTLKTRKDVSSGYVRLEFDITYRLARPSSPEEGEEEPPGTVEERKVRRNIFVRTIAEEVPVEKPVQPTEEPIPKVEGNSYDESSADGYDDIAGGSDGGGAEQADEKKSGTPRVMIAGFTTDPGTVHAGDTFKLTLRLRNTSKKTAVNNLLLTLQTPQAGEGETAADAFLPVEGSNTLYIENIPRDSSREVSVELSARTDLVQKPYPIEAVMKYEDEDLKEYDATANISIPIRQKARFELSRVTAMPEMIMIGEETNITFEIYNLGKTKLYNVSARIEDPSIANAEAFVGNLDAGATGSVDMMALGVEESSSDGTVKLLVTYEDQDGNQGTFESSCVIFVQPEMPVEEVMPDELQETPEERAPGLGVLKWILAIGGVIAIIVSGFVLAVKRKQKKEKEWADEILGSDQDERQ